MGPVLPVGARLTRRVREEPPPGELARVYSDRDATMSGAQRCGSAGMDRRPNAGMDRRPGELGRVGFTAGCLAGMDRRPSPHRENWAAWVSLPAVWPGWIAGRAPTGRTGPRGFHCRLSGRDGSPAEPPPGELGRVGFTTGCLAGWIAGRAPTGRTGPRGFHYRLFGGMDRRSNAAWVSPQAVNSRWWNPGERRESGEAPGWQGA